jgi:hypothetical protein
VKMIFAAMLESEHPNQDATRRAERTPDRPAARPPARAPRAALPPTDSPRAPASEASPRFPSSPPYEAILPAIPP